MRISIISFISHARDRFNKVYKYKITGWSKNEWLPSHTSRHSYTKQSYLLSSYHLKGLGRDNSDFLAPAHCFVDLTPLGNEEGGLIPPPYQIFKICQCSKKIIFGGTPLRTPRKSWDLFFKNDFSKSASDTIFLLQNPFKITKWVSLQKLEFKDLRFDWVMFFFVMTGIFKNFWQ